MSTSGAWSSGAASVRPRNRASGRALDPAHFFSPGPSPHLICPFLTYLFLLYSFLIYSFLVYPFLISFSSPVRNIS